MKAWSGRGFSLLEVFVAGAMFLLGTAGVLASWSTLTGVIETQRCAVDATGLAEDVLDELRLAQRGSDALAIGSHARFFDRARQPAGAVAPGGYVVSWIATPVDEAFTFRRVDLEVAWRGQDGRHHTIEFLTFRAG